MSTRVDPTRLVEQLNPALPRDVRVLAAAEVPASFHPREDAIGKTYEYRICAGGDLPDEQQGRVWDIDTPLDVVSMQSALPSLIGKHDFATFATRPRFKPKSTVREITAANLVIDDGLLVLRFSADAFLNHMVRNMVRALVKVGEGRLAPEAIADLLEARDRAASSGSAPASGLYLMRVEYPSPDG